MLYLNNVCGDNVKLSFKPNFDNSYTVCVQVNGSYSMGEVKSKIAITRFILNSFKDFKMNNSFAYLKCIPFSGDERQVERTRMFKKAGFSFYSSSGEMIHLGSEYDINTDTLDIYEEWELDYQISEVLKKTKDLTKAYKILWEEYKYCHVVYLTNKIMGSDLVKYHNLVNKIMEDFGIY
jgi:hypothetical protein